MTLPEFDTPKSFADFREGMLQKYSGLPAPAPDEVKNLSPDKWMDFQEYDFRSITYNGWASFVDDPNASNKRTIRMPGNHNEWAIQLPLDIVTTYFEVAEADTKFKIIAYLRCDATVTDGLAMTCGVYDTKKSVGVAQKNIDVSTISGTTYQKIAFDPVALSPSMYLWFAPPKREGDVQAVYIDRVVVVQE